MATPAAKRRALEVLALGDSPILRPFQELASLAPPLVDNGYAPQMEIRPGAGVPITTPEEEALRQRAAVGGLMADMGQSASRGIETLTGAQGSGQWEEQRQRAGEPLRDFMRLQEQKSKAKAPGATGMTDEQARANIKALHPNAPAELLSSITAGNYESTRKSLDAAAGRSERSGALSRQEEMAKARLEQQREEGKLNRSVQWARIGQQAEEGGASRELRRWIFEQEQDAKEKERAEKKQEKIEAVTVPDAEIAPGAKPTPQDAEKVKGVLSAKKALDAGIKRMRDLHTKYGTEKGGQGAMLMNQALTGIRLEAKTIAELGALSGPDQGLMESLAGDDPTSAWANVKGFFGTDNTEAALQGLEAWMAGKVAATLAARGYRMKEAAPTPKTARTTPQQALPKDAAGNLTLEDDSVSVLLNGKPKRVPRKNLEALKKMAAEKQWALEVPNG